MVGSKPAQIAIVADPDQARALGDLPDNPTVFSAREVLEELPHKTIKAVLILDPTFQGVNEVLGQSQSFPEVHFIIIGAPGSQSTVGSNVQILPLEDARELLKTLLPNDAMNLKISHPRRKKSESSDNRPDIPDYEILGSKPIGDGAAGVVWIAKHVKLGKLVALKIVHNDATILEMHGLSSYYALVSRYPDQLLPIVDLPRNLPGEKGGVYYATELADCIVQERFQNPQIYQPHTLDKQVLATSLSAEDAVNITIALLKQVRLLHMATLIHGDIKLSNVVFFKKEPRLMDVTTIRAFQPHNQEHDSKSKQANKETKDQPGTEGFIPEDGHGQPSGDLYSIGKVLYLLLVRVTEEDVPPNLTEGDLADIANHHLEPIKFMEKLALVIARACSVPLKTTDGKKTPKAPPGYRHATEMIRELRDALTLRQECFRNLELQELKSRCQDLKRDEDSADQEPTEEDPTNNTDEAGNDSE